MHEIVSFSKDIEFKNMINKITSISLEHTLMLDDNSNIKGDFIVSGKYKMTAASQIENDFSYKIPVDIEIDDKYDLSNLVIDIDDFTYEVIDEEILRVNIDLLLDKLEVKEKLDFNEKTSNNLDTDSSKNEDRENKDELVVGDDLFMERDDKEKLEIPADTKEDDIEVIDINDDLTDTIDDIKSCEQLEEKVITTSDNLDTNRDELSEDDLNTATEISSNFSDNIDSLSKDLMNENIKDKILDNNINFVDNKDQKEEINIVNNNSKEDSSSNIINLSNDSNNDSPSLFSSFDSSNETYSTYSVYILRDGDSVENIISKYKTTREKLEEYNDLNDLKIGTKVIIPSISNE